MSEQIKQYGWLPWGIATSLVVLIVVTVSYYDLLPGRLAILPWETAQGVDTMRAINEFEDGQIDMKAYWVERLGSFAEIVLLFVVGPTLWILGEIRSEDKPNVSDGGNLGKGVSWYVGVTLVITGLILVSSVAVMEGYYLQDTWENAARSRNADQVRTELMNMSYDLSEQYYVTDGWKGSINLEDLQSFNPNSRNDYVVASRSDSLVKIYGIGFKNGPNPDFKNANGQKGKLQLAVEITPGGEIYKFVDEDTNKL